MKTPLAVETLSKLVGLFFKDAQENREFLPTTCRTWGPNLRAFVRLVRTTRPEGRPRSPIGV